MNNTLPMSDPYDFDISLPLASLNVDQLQYSTNESDEGTSDFSDHFSSTSGTSGNNDSDTDSDHEQQDQVVPRLQSRPADSSNETTALSSENALDKAKHFLLKYSRDSSGPNTPIRSRIRRISLQLDEAKDDDSVSTEQITDNDDKQTCFNSKKTTAKTSFRDVNVDKQNIEPTKKSDDLIRTDGSQFNQVVSADEEQSDQSSEGALNHTRSRRPVESSAGLVFSPGKIDTGSEGSPMEDSIESIIHSSLNEMSGELKSEPNLVYYDPQKGNIDNLCESLQKRKITQATDKVEAIESKPTSSESSSVKSRQSSDFDCGVYEDELFEDEDPADILPVLSVVASAAKSEPMVDTEKNLDYSMDFSSDEADKTMQLQKQTSDNALNLSDPSPQSADSESISDQSINFNENVEHNAYHNEKIVDGTSATATNRELFCTKAMMFPKVESIVDNNINPQQKLPHSSITLDGSNALRVTSHKLDNTRSHEDIVKSNHPHVTILRAFEADSVEMKDVGTQFTGNHAAIQTDLKPDSVHDLFDPVPPIPTVTTTGSYTQKCEPNHSTTNLLRCQYDQPPLSKSPSLGSSMFTLGTFPASTSIYKQQLQALQEQILYKKRETERIINDWMAFQHFSPSGAERVSGASNR